MRKQGTRSERCTFAAKQRAMLCALLAVAFLDFAVCMVSVGEMNRETANQMSQTARMQIDEAYRECSQISNDMGRLLMENQELSSLCVNGTKREQIYAKGKLLEKLWYSFADKEEYHLFFYFQQTGELLGASWLDLKDGRESGIIDTILKKIGENHEVVWDLTRWDMFRREGTYYMLRAYCYNDVWFLCYAPASVLIGSLDAVYDGEKKQTVLLGSGGQILVNNETQKKINLPSKALQTGGTFYRFPWKRIQIVTEYSKELGIYIAVILTGYGGFSRMLLIQGIVLFMVLVTLFSFLILTIYTRKRIIAPVQKFIKGVAAYGEKEDGELELSGSDILELEQVNQQFKGFVRQIKDLKIDIYEQELLRQKLEMDNMKLQLKPHFFLNSLGTVVSLLQNGRSRDAISMCQASIRYLRYLFHAGLDEAAIHEAISHVKDYFDIMKLRYPDEVEMDLYVEEEAKGCLLPPLMIQTLVENSFKYGKVPGKALEVSVTITMERVKQEDCLCINVSDNGNGYREDYLRLWDNRGELPRQGGKHIGIANLKARLHYAYGEQASIRFYNSPMGGAVTEVRIPLLMIRRENEHEHTSGG